MSVVVLSGGVGGAKLVHGLARALNETPLTAIINVGDDFRHFGLHVSPDIDTVLYTLSGRANRTQGWGREGETWTFMDALRSLGAEDWFQLGDGDLALHVVRSARLKEGATLSAITANFAQAWGIGARLLPATDDPLRTILLTDEGELDFQTYFVARRCQPAVRQIRFEGAEQAQAAPGAVNAILGADAVIIAPSNPYLSIDPILAVRDIRDAIVATAAPVVAVSPLIGGQAVKGPTAKLMQELEIPRSVQAIAAHYAGLIDALLIDHRDESEETQDILIGRDDILMQDDAARVRVGEAALMLARRVRK